MDAKIKAKLSDGRQYRAMSLAPSGDAGRHIVEGYATTFNQPYVLWRDGDWLVEEQVDAHAFDGTDMQDVILQYNHDGRVFARTRNRTLTVKPDDRGLFVRADLGGTETGRQLHDEIKGGYTDRMSFGFTIAEQRTDKIADGHYLRTILKVGKLYDVSAVSIPANDYTEISARSYLDGVIEAAKAERLEAQERERERKRLETRLRLWRETT